MPDPERVVILNDASAVRGGATWLATRLACLLHERGQRVTYLAGDAGDPDLAARIDLVALQGRPLASAPAALALRGLYDRAMRRRVADWIAAHDTPGTVYHLHNWARILSPAVFDALRPVARRTVIHAHDFFLACPNGAYLDFPRASVCPLRPLSAPCLLTRCDKRSHAHKLWRAARQAILWRRLAPFLSEARFVMIHEAMRPWLERAIRPAHLRAIRNPVEPLGPPVADPAQNRRLVQIGQVQRLKGVFELAEAARRLKVTVDFIGTGEALEDLSAAYPEHFYHGWMPREEIGRFLAAARVAVVATQSPEPFCLSAFECLASGLPLVVSDSILPAPQLAGSGAALTFAAGDVAALTAVLAEVMEDDALVAQLARAARAGAAGLAQGFGPWVEAHERLYRGLLEEPAGASLSPPWPDEPIGLRTREAGP